MPPGRKKEIYVKFSPSSSGSKSATLKFTSDNCEPANANLEGYGKSCCFPAGTKITMTDGSYKNIEDVKIGDRVLSYNIKNDQFASWSVKMLGDPVHPVYEINDGLIRATVEHPFYVKKQDGKTGWGAIEPDQNAVRMKGTVLSLEIGDQILSEDEEWIEIYDITYHPEPIQTYNILSFSGRHNYFANGILVYEEYPHFIWINYYLDKLFDKFPILQILLQRLGL